MTRLVHFSKYHGLGNDFVIVDLRAVDAESSAAVQDPANVRAICDRRFGVGADGVLPILPAQGADARMRVLNADGSEAEMCGNGIRCVVRHLYERDPTMKRQSLAIDTGAGVLTCHITLDGESVVGVTVDMGAPRLERAQIPMTGPATERCLDAPLDLDGRTFSFTAVSMGNPHAITFVPETGPLLRALAEAVGPKVEHHPWFPQRTNVEFVHVHGPRELELVVWERGCGITLACGTGACATAVAACLHNHTRTDEEVAVRLLGGDLGITVAPEYRTVYMRGPGTHVFDATLDLQALSTP